MVLRLFSKNWPIIADNFNQLEWNQRMARELVVLLIYQYTKRNSLNISSPAACFILKVQFMQALLNARNAAYVICNDRFSYRVYFYCNIIYHFCEAPPNSVVRILSEFNYTQCVTCLTTASQTLDVILTHDPETILDHGIDEKFKDIAAASDHHPIYLVIECNHNLLKVTNEPKYSVNKCDLNP